MNVYLLQLKTMLATRFEFCAMILKWLRESHILINDRNHLMHQLHQYSAQFSDVQQLKVPQLFPENKNQARLNNKIVDDKIPKEQNYGRSKVRMK